VTARTALVVGDLHQRVALSALRGLAAHGWQVHLAGPWARALAGRSALSAGVHRVPAVEDGVEPFLDGVARVLAGLPGAVVLPCGDAELAVLAAARGRLPATAGLPDAEAVDGLLDKQRLTGAAAAAGFAAPGTVRGTPGTWPVVVKSVRHFEPGRRSARWEVRVVADAQALGAALASAHAAGVEVVVQERLEGQLVSLAMVLGRDGSVLARSQHRTTSTWPGAAGAAASAVTVPVDEQAATAGSALLRAAGWTGLAELEMIVPVSGPPALIDVNPRLYGSMALAAAAGAPLAHLAAEVLAGRQPAPAGDARAGVRYQWLQGELQRAAAEPHPARGVLRVLRAARGAVEPVWDLRDPRPALWLASRTPLWELRAALRR
jgi:predicted ATP-grasp superfamily ATP-dependent carboligase